MGKKHSDVMKSWSRYKKEKWFFRQDGRHRNQTNREINVGLFLTTHVWTSRTSVAFDSWFMGMKAILYRESRKKRCCQEILVPKLSARRITALSHNWSKEVFDCWMSPSLIAYNAFPLFFPTTLSFWTSSYPTLFNHCIETHHFYGL